jgi:omega-6 fatty acid desaturase (delta-12 desaturase)
LELPSLGNPSIYVVCARVQPTPGRCGTGEIRQEPYMTVTSSTDRTWRETLAPYAQPRPRRSVLDVATSIVPYIALSAVMYLVAESAPLLALGLAIPTAGFLLRTYMVFHDCTHGSFLPTKRGNAWLGTFAGLLVFECFESWRHSHAVHHGTAGDLDRRGVGDVATMTVAEYRDAPLRRRLAYRLFRNPLVMFGLGPLYALVLQPRLVSRTARPRIRRAVIRTNVMLAALAGAMCWLVGWQSYLLVQGSVVMLAGAAGIFLFYVQHQFEDTWWESSGDWTYADAALRGSSHLVLPKVLQFFTANIGLHHVHHLSTRIPNYNLQRAHDENPVFHSVPQIKLLDGVRAVRLKLWDESRGRLVTFAEARRRSPPIVSSWPTATTSSSPTR